uniref:PNG1 n=1 Tax=Arundo donax TaxID=35708 RepID=A0A0A9DSD7_ARUDO
MGPWWTTAPTWRPSPSACASWQSAKRRGRTRRRRRSGRRRSPTRSSRGCFRRKKRHFSYNSTLYITMVERRSDKELSLTCSRF